MLKKTIWFLGCLAYVSSAKVAHAQNNSSGQKSGSNYNTITTAVPFMRISPDARSGAMGDIGIALAPDANAQFWNVAKLAMSDKDAGLSMTYTPWLRDLVPDIFLAYLSGYVRFGADKDNKNQAISASMRYFSLGDINYTTIDIQPAGTGKPREFALDIGYSRKLSDNLSLGLSGKYIHSNIINGAGNSSGVTYKPGNAAAVDFGVFYTKPMNGSSGVDGSSLNAGLVISNIGSKISYSGGRKDFIPTNLGIGLAYNYQVDEFNKLTIGLDINKLLVPSPQITEDSFGNVYQTYPFNKSVMSGMLGSFGDAPGGMKEELQEVMLGVGAEYSYQNQFFARAGYFYESKYKGDRRYFSVGLGVKYNVFGLNVAYVVPGSGINRNPLSNTLRFSLLFDIDDLGKIIKPDDAKKNDKKSKKGGSDSKKDDQNKDERKEK